MEYKILILIINTILCVSLLFTQSCNDGDFYEEQQGKSILVVDGWIENNQNPRVILTYSTPYFSIVDSNSFMTIVEYSFKVSVNDGEHSEVLTFGPDTNYFPPYIYRGYEIFGEPGKTYQLVVSKSKYIAAKDTFVNDTLITSTTTIPKPPEIDTAWFELEPDKDSLGTIKIVFTDDINVHNYYRILTLSKNSYKRYIPVLSSTIDDDLFKKATITYTLFKGRAAPIMEPEDVFYKIGDVVKIKFCTISKKSYIFWNTFQLESLNAINPFASSNANLQGNIEGEGLGIWSGQGVVYYTLEIK